VGKCESGKVGKCSCEERWGELAIGRKSSSSSKWIAGQARNDVREVKSKIKIKNMNNIIST